MPIAPEATVRHEMIPDVDVPFIIGGREIRKEAEVVGSSLLVSSMTHDITTDWTTTQRTDTKPATIRRVLVCYAPINSGVEVY